MFGIGFPELIVIFVVALIALGPKRLPDLARAIGRGVVEFRRAMDEIKGSFELDGELKNVKQDLADSIRGIGKAVNLDAITQMAQESDDEKPLAGLETGPISEKSLDAPVSQAPTIEGGESGTGERHDPLPENPKPGDPESGSAN